MKAYIKKIESISLFEQAKSGLFKLGYEIKYYTNPNFYTENDSIFIGSINDINNHLKFMNLKPLKRLDYPDQLKHRLHRRIRIIKHSELHVLKFPYFIKPVYRKSFGGRIVKEFKDLIGVPNEDLYYSNKILKIISEYRCYIINGKLIGVKHYKGNPFKPISEQITIQMIKEFTDAPKAFSMDLGVTSNGKTVLIECNDGITTGNYGLSDYLYAKFLVESYKTIIKK